MITTIKNQADINEPTVLIGYLVDGSKSVPLNEGNRDYREVQDAINGVGDYENAAIVLEEAYTQEQIDEYEQAKKLADVKTFIDGYIQAPIDAYNLANGVDFANAHSCADYKDVDGYTHKQFCIDIWEFNVAVWEKSRQIQLDVASGTIHEPTMEEFVAMLPVWQS